MKNTTIIIAFFALLLSFGTMAQSQGHSEEIEIQEQIFAKARSLSEAQSKYKWLEDYYIENKEQYIDFVLTTLNGNSSDKEMSDAVNLAHDRLIIDFDKVATDFSKKKEDKIKAGTKSNEDNLFNSKALNEPCNNADFETGDFTGWELFAGKVNNQQYGVTNMNPTAPGVQHNIVTGGNDPNVPSLPKLFPGGGNSSVHLGDYGTGSKAASMKQTFKVDANSASYTYSYALVMEDPGHTPAQQPFFKVNMYDESNQPISCAMYAVIAGSNGDPGFLPYGGGIFGGASGYYLPWRTTFIPLDGYIGQNVTIEFITGDCSQSGHFGYAYIDANCSPLDVTKSSDFICNGEEVILSGPPGAGAYLWTPGGQTTQSISTNVIGDYSVTVTPVVGGAACSATLDITVDGSLDHPKAHFHAVPNAICVGEDVMITDSSYVIGTTAIEKWEWDLNGDGIIDTTAINPGSTNYSTAGNYDITLTITNNGCTDSKTISIFVNQGPDPAWVAPPTMCDNADPLDLNTLVTGTPGGTWSGTGVTGNLFDPSVGSQSITYNVNDATCDRSETHTIEIAALPIITFNIPDEICLKGDPIVLAATPTGGVFALNGQTVTEFDPEANGLGQYEIEYTVANPNFPQCFSTHLDTIEVVDGFPISANIPDYFCFGEENYAIQINPTGGVFTGTLNNDNILNISNAPEGNYTVAYEYTSPEGCTGHFLDTFTVGPDLKISYNFDQACNQEITLSARPIVGNYVDYVWYDEDSTILGTGGVYNGRVEQYGERTFYLLATDNHGCQAHYSSTDSVNKAVGPEMFVIPNIITPNGDGKNDFMLMPLMDNECVEYRVLILNRWGNLVYECSRSNPIFEGKNKNGDNLTDGVYFYKVVSDDFDCGTSPFKEICYGFITIVSK